MQSQQVLCVVAFSCNESLTFRICFYCKAHENIDVGSDSFYTYQNVKYMITSFLFGLKLNLLIYIKTKMFFTAS